MQQKREQQRQRSSKKLLQLRHHRQPLSLQCWCWPHERVHWYGTEAQSRDNEQVSVAAVAAVVVAWLTVLVVAVGWRRHNPRCGYACAVAPRLLLLLLLPLPLPGNLVIQRTEPHTTRRTAREALVSSRVCCWIPYRHHHQQQQQQQLIRTC